MCLKKNLENEYIDHIFILAESGENITTEPMLENYLDKVSYHRTDKRPTYNDFFAMINIVSEPNDINIIANSDIFFDSSLGYISTMKTNQCFALSVDFQRKGK